MKYISIIVLIVLSFASCEERFTNVVEFDLPDHDSRIVSYCFVENSADKVYVSVSQSIGVLERRTESTLKDVNIKLYEDGNVIMDNFVLDTNLSQSNHIFSADKTQVFNPNHTYSLEVSSDHFPTTKGTTSPLTQVELKEINYIVDGATSPDGYTSDAIEIKFDDPANENNFYVVSGEYIVSDSNQYFNGVYMESQDPRIKMGYNNISLNPNFIIGNGSTFLYFSDENGLNGKLNQFKFSTYQFYGNGEEIPKLKIKLFSVTKEFYHFINSATNYSEFNFFSEPVEVTTNMENGFGMFSMFGYHEKVIEL